MRLLATIALVVTSIGCRNDSRTPVTPTPVNEPVARLTVTIDSLGSAVAIPGVSHVRFDASGSTAEGPVRTPSTSAMAVRQPSVSPSMSTTHPASFAHKDNQRCTGAARFALSDDQGPRGRGHVVSFRLQLAHTLGRIAPAGAHRAKGTRPDWGTRWSRRCSGADRCDARGRAHARAVFTTVQRVGSRSAGCNSGIRPA